MEDIKALFTEYSQEKIINCKQLPQSGSERRNYVLETSDTKYIITYNENIRENEAFFYLTQIFRQHHIPCPKILYIAENRLSYIQDYLGDETLFSIISEEGQTKRVEGMIKQSLLHLHSLQVKATGSIDFTKSFEYEEYDELPITHDLYYFKNFLVDVLEITYHKSSLLKEFKKIVQYIEDLEPKGVMLRDFQSRNVMINREGQVGFIDYQSAMKGPLMYDVVSLLFQAKANFSEAFKGEMLDYYYRLWDDEKVVEQLKASLEYIQLIRFMQVLGAYGFRGLIQRKSHFISSLDQGIKNLSELINEFSRKEEFPELNTIIQKLTTPNTHSKIKEILNS